MRLAWADGRLLDRPDEPVLSVLDHGLMVGDGVFETLQILDGRPMALDRHLRRLTRSAVGLDLDEPDLDAVRAGIAATVDGRGIDFGRIRVTVTSGPGPLGSPRGGERQAVVVIAEPCGRPEETTKVVTVGWPRNERGAVSGLKTTSYAENAKMLAYAAARGASEAILPNTIGALCEGTGTNIFYVVGDELVTPTLASGCLAGITRELILEWCDGVLPVVERDAPIEVLQECSEAFLVSSIRDVQGLHAIDHRVLPAPGPMTAQAARIFVERVREEL